MRLVKSNVIQIDTARNQEEMLASALRVRAQKVQMTVTFEHAMIDGVHKRAAKCGCCGSIIDVLYVDVAKCNDCGNTFDATKFTI